MARRYIIRGKEEKLAVVKEVLSGKSVRAWEPEIQIWRSALLGKGGLCRYGRTQQKADTRIHQAAAGGR